MYRFLLGFSGVQSLLERIEHQLRVHRATHSPTYDPSGENIDAESQVHEAGPVRHKLKSATYRQLVRPRGHEASLNAIQWASRTTRWQSLARPATVRNASEAFLTQRGIWLHFLCAIPRSRSIFATKELCECDEPSRHRSLVAELPVSAFRIWVGQNPNCVMLDRGPHE